MVQLRYLTEGELNGFAGLEGDDPQISINELVLVIDGEVLSGSLMVDERGIFVVVNNDDQMVEYDLIVDNQLIGEAIALQLTHVIDVALLVRSFCRCRYR